MFPVRKRLASNAKAKRQLCFIQQRSKNKNNRLHPQRKNNICAVRYSNSRSKALWGMFQGWCQRPSRHYASCYPCHRQQWLAYLWLAEMNSFFYFCTSIYKEELKTIVRKLLACMQPNHREAFTVLWNPYRRVSSRGATCANMLQPRSVQQKTRKWLSVILVLRGSIWTFVFNNTTTTHATPRLPNASASYV